MFEDLLGQPIDGRACDIIYAEEEGHPRILPRSSAAGEPDGSVESRDISKRSGNVVTSVDPKHLRQWIHLRVPDRPVLLLRVVLQHTTRRSPQSLRCPMRGI